MPKRPKKQQHSIILLTLGGILLSVILFNILLASLQNPLVMTLDRTLSEQIYKLRTPFLTDIMLVITSFGGIVLLFGGLLVTTILLLKKEKKEALFFLSVLLLGLGLNLFIKDIVERPRPDIAPLLHLSSFSFPSGHAMNSFIFYSLLAVLIFHFTKNKLVKSIVTLVFVLLILLIGFSRVYLGVHYPSDIIAGFLGGVIIFLPAKALIKHKFFNDF